MNLNKARWAIILSVAVVVWRKFIFRDLTQPATRRAQTVEQFRGAFGQSSKHKLMDAINDYTSGRTPDAINKTNSNLLLTLIGESVSDSGMRSFLRANRNRLGPLGPPFVRAIAHASEAERRELRLKMLTVIIDRPGVGSRERDGIYETARRVHVEKELGERMTVH